MALQGGRRRSGPRKPLPQNAAYPEALVKLFPVEGVTLLPMVSGITAGNRWITAALVAAIVLLMVLLRAAATRPKGGGKPDWTAVFVSVISFLLYASALQVFGLFLEPASRHVSLMSFATIVWVAIVPLIPQRSS